MESIILLEICIVKIQYLIHMYSLNLFIKSNINISLIIITFPLKWENKIVSIQEFNFISTLSFEKKINYELNGKEKSEQDEWILVVFISYYEERKEYNFTRLRIDWYFEITFYIYIFFFIFCITCFKMSNMILQRYFETLYITKKCSFLQV